MQTDKKPQTALDKLLAIIRADALKRQQEKAAEEKRSPRNHSQKRQ